MFKFITNKPFLVNILAGIGILLVLLLIFLGSLALLTRHGKMMRIPSVTGLSYEEAKKALEAQGFEVQVQDSTYNDTVPALQVVKQFPEADNMVKINRTVYITINRAIPPSVEMPNLVSMTFRNAEMVLRHYGLQMGDTLYKPDFAKNSILDQQFEGQSIKPGTKILQGSKITLVLGSGIGGMQFLIPDLIGLPYQEAKIQLEAEGLAPGAIVPDNDVSDTANAYVYRQSPPRFNEEKTPNRIRPGQTIDLWLSVKKPDIKPDSTQALPLQ